MRLTKEDLCVTFTTCTKCGILHSLTYDKDGLCMNCVPVNNEHTNTSSCATGPWRTDVENAPEVCVLVQTRNNNIYLARRWVYSAETSFLDKDIIAFAEINQYQEPAANGQ